MCCSSDVGWLVWVKYLSWFQYGFSALMINQWTGVTDITCQTHSGRLWPYHKQSKRVGWGGDVFLAFQGSYTPPFLIYINIYAS